MEVDYFSFGFDEMIMNSKGEPMVHSRSTTKRVVGAGSGQNSTGYGTNICSEPFPIDRLI